VIAFGVLSTYPPTRCGIATFSAALVRHLNAPGARSSAAVVRIGDDVLSGPTPPEVVAEVANGSRGGPAAAAAALNRFDVAIVQHEYGIYGGPDGEEVLAVLDQVRVPVVAVLHTVLATPTIWQRGVLSRICHAADAIVVPSQTAASRLLQVYGVDSRRITVIPHGAETEIGLVERNRKRPRQGQSPLLLTWGLLGPGKGVEWRGGLRLVSGVQRCSPLGLGELHRRARLVVGEAGLRGYLIRAGRAAEAARDRPRRPDHLRGI